MMASYSNHLRNLESLPSEKEVGSQVFSSTMNISGLIKVKTEKIGKDTTLEKIIALIEKSQKGKAKIVTATNLFTHIDDLDEVVRGVKKLLTDDGVFIIEVYYLVDLLEKRYFDLIYHEHLSYLSILPLDKFFKTHV